MTFTHPHQRNDWIALAMASIIAGRLRQDETLVEKARAWIVGLRQKGRDFVAHREWEGILNTRSAAEIADLLVVENDEGQRLRSSHPFKGIITEAERLVIIEDAYAS